MDLIFDEKPYQKEILILNSFYFDDKDPRFTQAKSSSCTKFTQYMTILQKGYDLQHVHTYYNFAEFF